MKPATITADYSKFLTEVKGRIQSARIQAGRAVNRELVMLYWDIGRGIVEKQRTADWGDGVVERLAADLRAEFPDMRWFTTWSSSRVRKHDILVATNYLTEDDVDTLNRLVVILLEQAELRAKQQKELTLAFWRSSVDRMLAGNDQPLLAGPGSVSHEAMKTTAGERYEDFDAKRRAQEASEADAEDLKAIEDLEKDLKRKGGKA